jgi:hypothetical protein
VAGWDLTPEVIALCPASLLLERLLLVFTVNAHSFRGAAALFNLATKLTHSCGQCDVEYSTAVPDGGDAAAAVGLFRATRDIAVGRILTTSYVPTLSRLVYALCVSVHPATRWCSGTHIESDAGIPTLVSTHI